MKIYIIGSVGSGKTTLARQLSKVLTIPHFETDNFVWSRQGDGDMRNAESVRDDQLLTAVRQINWIIEGVHTGWTERAMHAADVVVFLDMPYAVRTYRFVFRYLKQKARVERSNYKPSLSMLVKMFKWNRYFEETIKPEFLLQCETLPNQFIVIKNRQEIDWLMNDLLTTEW
ncbi:DNA topology modulation protein FlaR [Planococcus sp. ANT_H30]|uniref:AAA family ATPase n=1 Tax=Planococcus sp. ANT_H30 TaxID=2597347 RepID=UPI0011F03559|nr:AAA family ATPase [Planococcus sp. ANT_H30]KAA0955149.1 DNA topology modulation protein FlaR [Planococcus sp. ANT_H30]